MVTLSAKLENKGGNYELINANPVAITKKPKISLAMQSKLKEIAATRRMISSKYDCVNFTSRTNYDDPTLRHRITCRVREEVEINAHLEAILGIRQVDLFGTVPRVKFAPNGNATAAAELTTKYNSWAVAAKKGKKLRLAGLHQDRDGDVGAILKENPRINHPVKLDIQGVEQDQIGGDAASKLEPREYDGIVYDEDGNITHYRVRRSVVGRSGTMLAKSELVPSMFFIHMWDQKRFRQQRATSKLKSVVHLGETLREYRASSLKKADKASKTLGVITGAGSSDCSIETGEVLELEEDGFLCINGEDASVHAFEHSINVDDVVSFTASGVAEMGRSLKQPKSQSLGSYADENFASGKMGRIDSQKCIAVDRYDLACDVLDPILRVWLLMAYRATHNFGEDYLSRNAKNYLQQFISADPDDPTELPPHVWQYDKTPDVDPQKEAKGNEVKLATGQTTLTEIHTANGDCWLGPGGKLEEFAGDLGISEKELQLKICARLWEAGAELMGDRLLERMQDQMNRGNND